VTKQSHEIASSALGLLAMTALLLFPGCESTYKKETIKESVKLVAKRDYSLDVDVRENGKTLGVRYSIPGLFNELIAEDQTIWKKMDSLMQTLSRVALSVDVPPTFLVLEVADLNNPSNKVVFTQCVTDVKKIYADALSRNQYFDRLAIEFEINGRRTPFDPDQTDLVSLMMMAVEADAAPATNNKEFEVADVQMTDFLPKVASSMARRFFRENKKARKEAVLRSVAGSFESNTGETNFKLFLDLSAIPGGKLAISNLQTTIFPLVSNEINGLFKSYRFSGFSNIVVMDKNSGAIAITGRK